jgi:hypothetical protein
VVLEQQIKVMQVVTALVRQIQINKQAVAVVVLVALPQMPPYQLVEMVVLVQ